VKPDKATKVENQLVSMALQGKLPGVVNEGKLIEMLERIGINQSTTAANKISIQRKKYAFDSDDEDDNDDDLM
jgi:programmed cell death protein 5